MNEMSFAFEVVQESVVNKWERIFNFRLQRVT